MKSFRTEFKIHPSPKSIDHSQKLLTIGSCFSEVMGEKLTHNKFNVLVNPFGIIFNPVSIFDLLSLCLQQQKPQDDLFLNRHHKYYHFQFHSRVNAGSKKELEALLHEKFQQVNDCTGNSSHILITLGTAFVFRHLVTGKIVANCHKQPEKEFKKELLGLDDMKRAFDGFYELLKDHNPKVQMVLTVSPVRHVKDGIPENQVSKGLLRVFCDQLEKQYQDIYYFPAYELQMDDLRDYRFYKDDLIHPNATAENYIWEKFKKSFFESDTLDILNAVDQVQRNLNHRPFEPLSGGHFDFLSQLLQKISRMPSNLDFTEEKKRIVEQLKQIEAYQQNEKPKPGDESK